MYVFIHVFVYLLTYLLVYSITYTSIYTYVCMYVCICICIGMYRLQVTVSRQCTATSTAEVGTIGAMQIPVVGLQPLRSVEQPAAPAVLANVMSDHPPMPSDIVL